MEKQRDTTKGRKRRRRAAAAAAAVDDSEDRISKLPEAILHHILFSLTQRTAAKTSVLSKAWRYLWCTRPKINFRYGITAAADQNKEEFLSVLDRTLRGYHDRKLRLQEITLHLPPPSSGGETDSFLQKWICALVQSMCPNKFHLHFLVNYPSSNKISISSSTFRSESLQNLSLMSCALRLTPSARPLHLKHLQKLALYDVDIPEEILDHILSNCMFVEYMFLGGCTGFKRIRLKHAASLKDFRFYGDWKDATSIAMGDCDIPTLRRIEIHKCLLSVVNRDHRFYFSRLTHLTMKNVKLSSSDLFSCDLPCLKKLRIYLCSGIKEINLLGPSMKQMEIYNRKSPFKVTVDAPSIVSFRYEGLLPQSVSFTALATSNHDWKSYIDLTCFPNETSLYLQNLIGLLKALSQSEITIDLGETMVGWLRNQLPFINEAADLPVVVDHLIVKRLRSPFACDFLKSLFLKVRPRFIYTDSNITKALIKTHQVKEIVLDQSELGNNFLQRFSDGVSMLVYYRIGGIWHPFQPISLSKLLSTKGESMDQTFLPTYVETKIKLLIFK